MSDEAKQDFRSHKNLHYNVIVFVVRTTICVAQ